MKKRIIRIAAFVGALALIVGVGVFANGLVGNPISKLLATHTAEKRLEERYGDRDFVLERVSFSFKDGRYHAYITSPSSIDSSFSLLIGMDGKLIDDYYDTYVTGGRNTASRIEEEYRKRVDAVLDSPSFPYSCDIAYGEIVFAEREYLKDPSTPSYAIVTEDLVLDRLYDVNAMGAQAGRLSIYVDDETVTADRLAEILLAIKEVFDQAGVSFYVIDCVLEYPKGEDGAFREGRVEVMDFRYSDIYAEGMTERVRESNQKAQAYYAEQDAEKEIQS